MQPFTYLPHTADIKIRVWGKNLEQVFQNSLLAIADYLNPTRAEPTAVIKQPIQTESSDQLTLLVDFLNEIVSLSQIHKAVFDQISFSRLTATCLQGVLHGASVEKFGHDIKAVTYHQGKFEKTDSGYEAEFILDI